MDTILRAVAIYAFLLIVFRLSGKRSLAQITTIDFVLLLVIGEATQQALLSDDYSLTNAFIAILALISMDIFMSLIKQRLPGFALLSEGAPVVILKDGQLLRDRLQRSRVDESDILEAARSSQGLENLSQIQYAILERSGGITVVPKSKSAGAGKKK